MIEAAAIKLKKSGAVISLPPPARHCHLIKAVCEQFDLVTAPDHEQGFLWSQNGEFVDRNIAATRALAMGQIKKLSRPPELYSEDLW